MPSNFELITAEQLQEKYKSHNTLILNIVAEWCSDCTEQQDNLNVLIDAYDQRDVCFLQLVAQKEKGVFVNKETEAFIDSVGGHGYPRTILIKNGEIVSTDNVEVISAEELLLLSKKFNRLL